MTEVKGAAIGMKYFAKGIFVAFGDAPEEDAVGLGVGMVRGRVQGADVFELSVFD